jgi:hypothetical protein
LIFGVILPVLSVFLSICDGFQRLRRKMPRKGKCHLITSSERSKNWRDDNQDQIQEYEKKRKQRKIDSALENPEKEEAERKKRNQKRSQQRRKKRIQLFREQV